MADKRFLDLLREHSVALALTDTSWMLRPWEMKEKFDLVTTDFVYVRWLGGRQGIEKITQVWDKTVVDRTEDLKNWVGLFRQFISKNLKIFSFANNHYGGFGPETIKTFWDLWKMKQVKIPPPPNSIQEGVYKAAGGGRKSHLFRRGNHELRVAAIQRKR